MTFESGVIFGATAVLMVECLVSALMSAMHNHKALRQVESKRREAAEIAEQTAQEIAQVEKKHAILAHNIRNIRLGGE